MDRHGWRQDPYGIHEHRYFSVGHPTSLVRDNGRVSFDDASCPAPKGSVRPGRVDAPPGADARPAGTAGAAAGWYRDPSGSKTQWYWSGTAWTKCLQPVIGEALAGPPAPAAGPSAPDITPAGIRPRLGRRTKLAVAGGGLALALAALVGASTTQTVEIKSVAPSSASQPPTAPTGGDGLSTWVRDHAGLLTALGSDATIESAAMTTWSSSDYTDESSLLVAAEQMTTDIEAAQSVPSPPDGTAQKDWTQWYTSLGAGQAAVLRAISESSTGGVLTAQGFLQVATTSFDTAGVYLVGLNTRLHSLGVDQQIPPDPASGVTPPRPGTRPASDE